MIHHKIDQNSDEWDILRMKKFTTSMFKELFADKSSAAYKKAIYRVAYERLTDEKPESFKGAWMDRGHEFEEDAYHEYEKQTFLKTSDPGFFELNEWVGSSPDRLVGKEGLLETKCPAFNTMIEYQLKQKLPSIYRHQVHGQLWVTGRKWCDFMCYHPHLKPIIIRVERDEVIITDIITQINESIEKVKYIINKIK